MKSLILLCVLAVTGAAFADSHSAGRTPSANGEHQSPGEKKEHVDAYSKDAQYSVDAGSGAEAAHEDRRAAFKEQELDFLARNKFRF